jgi:methylmalonyl-CoA mutase C-terminal domain/subunit
MTLVPRVLELLAQQGQAHVRVMLGGIIPDEDRPRLKELGVAGVFGPGTSTQTIVKQFREAVLPDAS